MNDKHKVSQIINASHNTLDVNDDKLEHVDIAPKTKAKAKGRKPSRATVDFNAVCQSIRASQVDCSRLPCVDPQSDFYILAKETTSVSVNGIQGALASKDIRSNTCFTLR